MGWMGWMGWVGLGWDLCAGLLYEHRFAVLLKMVLKIHHLLLLFPIAVLHYSPSIVLSKRSLFPRKQQRPPDPTAPMCSSSNMYSNIFQYVLQYIFQYVLQHIQICTATFSNMYSNIFLYVIQRIPICTATYSTISPTHQYHVQ